VDGHAEADGGTASTIENFDATKFTNDRHACGMAGSGLQPAAAERHAERLGRSTGAIQVAPSTHLELQTTPVEDAPASAAVDVDGTLKADGGTAQHDRELDATKFTNDAPPVQR